MSDPSPLTVHFPIGKMIKKDEFDSLIESLRGEIAAIRTSLFHMKNAVILQALREENINLKNRIKIFEAHFESSDIIRNKMD